jgi:hypothetical protein
MADYQTMTVDELRDRLKEQGVGGIWDMRKDELVEALEDLEGDREDGDRKNRSAGDRGERGDKSRPGATLTTQDHDEIRAWAEARGAEPATVPGTEHDDHLGVLRFDFPGYGGESLEHVDWDTWFKTFDDRNLTFVYQERKKDGAQSNFFRLTSPDREDA